MTTFDFAPLYRSTVGFDRLASLLDSAASNDRATAGYPPYNIELINDDNYQITMAVAGFTEGDITLEVENGTLTVSASKSVNDDEKRTYLHQGIAERDFKRQFKLADHIEVTGARMENGLLHIDLVREIPEAMKPRRIEINGKSPRKLLKSA